MKIIGLEERLVVPELLAAWSNIFVFEQTPEKGFGNVRIAQWLRNMTDAQGNLDMRIAKANKLDNTEPLTIENTTPTSFR